MISRKKKAAGEGQEKKNKEGEEKIILGNSSGFLCVSLSLLSPLSLSLSLSTDTPPFFLGKIFWIWEEGDWQTLSLLSLSLSLSLSRCLSQLVLGEIWSESLLLALATPAPATGGKEKEEGGGGEEEEEEEKKDTGLNIKGS